MIRFIICLLILLSLSIPYELIGQDEQSSDKEPFSLSDLPFDLFGFAETRHGLRLQDDPLDDRSLIISETRLQVNVEHWFDWGEIKVKNDFIYDWHQGEYVNDLREANITFTPIDWLDVNAGRQILTWGKGDLLFVNDLFPKGYQAFFIGRSIEYLKAPSDAIKLTFHIPWFELNTVYVPRFNSDRFIDGSFLSYFNPFTNSFSGFLSRDNFNVPNRWFKDAEYHWRVRKSIKDWDVALYGNYGFWKSPAGVDLSNGDLTFPRLTVHGFSIEKPIKGGIAVIEFGHYWSTQDKSGDDFTIRNSEIVFLLGYNYDFKNDFKVVIQYFAQDILQFSEFVSSLPPGAEAPNQWRDMVTLKLTKLLNKQKLELSSVLFYSIADSDVYWRWTSSYKIDDYWKVELGINYFDGVDQFTFWNQLSFNNNAYIGIRRAF